LRSQLGPVQPAGTPTGGLFFFSAEAISSIPKMWDSSPPSFLKFMKFPASQLALHLHVNKMLP